MTEYARPTENPLIANPEFNGRSFTILKFAPPGGFTLKTRASLTRRDAITTPFPAREINQANKRERDFWEKKKPGNNPLMSPNFRTKVGLYDLEANGDTLSYVVKPVTFVTYNDEELGLAKPENIDEGLEKASPTGVAMILFTTEKDGTNKMILQHRGLENRNYRDIPGASVAGIMDGKLEQSVNDKKTKTRPVLIPVNNSYVIGEIGKETEEEVGITEDQLADVKITGISLDTLKTHYELLLMGRANISADEVERQAEDAKTKERGDYDFSEDFFVIDGTPEAIETLLVDVKCPLPPTHVAAFVAAGYSLLLERDGKEEADAWKDRLEISIQDNWKSIDALISLGTNGEQHGFNPKLAPQEQGLPQINEELRRTGLIH